MKHGDLSNKIEENIIVHLDSLIGLKTLTKWEKLKLIFSNKAKKEVLQDVNRPLYNYVHRLINKSNYAVTLVTNNEQLFKYMDKQYDLFLPCGIIYAQDINELHKVFMYKNVSFFITEDDEYFNCGLPQAITFEEFSQISGVK